MKCAKTRTVTRPDRIITSFQDFKEMIGCGNSSAEKIARESGALFKIGRIRYVNLDKVKVYINSMCENYYPEEEDPEEEGDFGE